MRAVPHSAARGLDPAVGGPLSTSAVTSSGTFPSSASSATPAAPAPSARVVSSSRRTAVMYRPCRIAGMVLDERQELVARQEQRHRRVDAR